MISVVFLGVSFFHIFYTFLYHDAEIRAVPGGSISEGIIGPFPHLNPLKPKDENNTYILSLLYRSLLQYDIESGKIISDLASCDTSNISYVECYLKKDIYWSDGTAITIDDILATYQVLKNTDVNPIMSSLLNEMTIEQKDDIIIFQNNSDDINTLNVFFQPILAKNVIDDLSGENIRGNFAGIDEIYSGYYTIENIAQDQSVGITRIILEKNTQYHENPILVDQLVLKIFPNTQAFIKNKDSVNIFNDTRNVLGESVPRLAAYEYILPQYVSLFLNKETLQNNALRKHILSEINRDKLIELLGEKKSVPVLNPYLTEKNIDVEAPGQTLDEIMADLGYFKKEKILTEFEKNFKSSLTLSDEVTPEKDTNGGNEISSSGSLLGEWEGSQLESIEDAQQSSVTISSPGFIEKYNFISKDDILLNGTTLEGTRAVYVNDYQLQGYTAGEKNFFYRIRESFGNIQPGRNIYTIYFELPDEESETGYSLEKIEDIIILYSRQRDILEQEKQKLLSDLQQEYQIRNQEQQKQAEENRKSIEELKSNDIEYITQKSAIDGLKENRYYNSEGDIFSLDFYYVDTEKDLEQTALFIQETIENTGIEVEMFPVSINGLVNIVKNKNSYHIVLAGIHLGYFDENIFPYFHSSQSKNGYNFSQIRKTSLDILLEEMKSGNIERERAEKTKEKILDILRDEYIISPLYTPRIHLLIDKKIKNISFPEYIPLSSLRGSIAKNLYIQEKRVIRTEEKNWDSFKHFIFQDIYGL
ncbi:ABC transporter substrate-binding protein [Candidatus Gracilibacteria bacterium]|nr:ABC transporter substrate-binding protein [Candidatus Gracilibacteria bacterium]